MQLVDDLCERMAVGGAKEATASIGDSCGLKNKWTVSGHRKQDDHWPVCLALVENDGPNCARVAGLEFLSAIVLLPFNAVPVYNTTVQGSSK